MSAESIRNNSNSIRLLDLRMSEAIFDYVNFISCNKENSINLEEGYENSTERSQVIDICPIVLRKKMLLEKNLDKSLDNDMQNVVKILDDSEPLNMPIVMRKRLSLIRGNCRK